MLYIQHMISVEFRLYPICYLSLNKTRDSIQLNDWKYKSLQYVAPEQDQVGTHLYIGLLQIRL